jgi:hypothetical protein
VRQLPGACSASASRSGPRARKPGGLKYSRLSDWPLRLDSNDRLAEAFAALRDRPAGENPRRAPLVLVER